VKASGRQLALLAALAGAAWWAPALALRWARPAVLNFGPNDEDYVRGFRSDWERDGFTRFRWTTPSAVVTLPLRVEGDGFLLRLRMRRHFVEPAAVRLTVEGGTVASFELRADPSIAYRVVEVPLPALAGSGPFTLGIDAPSTNPRPLGIALDWMEVAARGPGQFHLELRTRVAIAVGALAAVLATALAGLALPWALAQGGILVAAASAGAAWDPLGFERIARLGLPAFIVVGAFVVALVRWRRSAPLLDVDSRALAGALTALTLLALLIRLVLVLHPQFYYADVKIHGRFAWQLARDGLPTFLREFTANQFRHSLGLQMENGHWYAFPYPPAFYILAWPLLRLAHYRPEAAVAILAAAVNSLQVLGAFAIARRLGLTARGGLAAAGAVVLLPIYTTRLSLAYFPALVGHAMDTLVLLVLLRYLRDLGRPRVVLGLATLVAAALLTYTQSLLNLGILLPLFFAIEVLFDRTAHGRRRQLGLAAAGLLGILVAGAVFYGRYVPVFLDMRRGVPMPEERLLNLDARAPAAQDSAAEAPDDPYAGPGLDLARGARKAAWRLWIFYRWFAPAVVAGIVLLAWRLEPTLARLVVAWALTYLLLNLASGGLPGPNLFRYNKDIEAMAPLACVALATTGEWLWERRSLGRLTAIAGAAGFLVFGATRALRELVARFVLER
jgi:hypothetical protein